MSIETTFRLWPVSNEAYDTRFTIVADGEKGFLRIHPCKKPEKAVVIPESEIGRIIFLQASETTFERNRVLILFKTPQSWPFYQPGFSSSFILVYCRVNDISVTPEQQSEVEDFLKELEESYRDEQDFIVSDDDEDEEASSSKKRKKETKEPKKVKKQKRLDETSQEIQQSVHEAGVEKIQTLLIENINTAIFDLFCQLTETFNACKNHVIDPEPKESDGVFFASFEKSGIDFYCISSLDNEILLTIEAAILCRKQLFTDLDDIATVVFHRPDRVHTDLRDFKPIMIFFVPKGDAPVVCFESFKESDAEEFLLYLQNLEKFPVVYTQKDTNKLGVAELDPLRHIKPTDIDEICEAALRAKESNQKLEEVFTTPNEVQTCLLALELQLPDYEDDDDDQDESSREDSDDEDFALSQEEEDESSSS